MNPSGIVTLTTDFGLSDGYVGVMKGVILGIWPEARLVDLTHGLPPQDVEAAAWTLLDAIHFFPAGTVHLAVVDPGVGSSRRGIACFKNGHYFVGPDNGLFSGFLPPERAVSLDKPELFLSPVSRTFHGRDIFAPVAARLAGGMPLEDAGSPLTSPVEIPLPRPTPTDAGVRGEVVIIDRFGNLITNIPDGLLPQGQLRVRIAGAEITGLFPSYSALPEGCPAAVISSGGRLEIAVASGSAALVLGAGKHCPVEVERV